MTTASPLTSTGDIATRRVIGFKQLIRRSDANSQQPTANMFKTSVLFVCIAFAFAQQIDAADITSGLQPGETAAAFHVQDVTGPRAGHSLCYACAFGKRAVINIQTQVMTNELVQLIKKLDSIVASAAGRTADSTHAFIVLLTEDPDAAEQQLRQIAEREKIQNVPLTYYDELVGPPHYRISIEAETTVMMWINSKVRFNRAYSNGELTSGEITQIVDRVRQLSTVE